MDNHIFNGTINYKWSFSIAMLVCQRVFLNVLSHPFLGSMLTQVSKRQGRESRRVDFAMVFVGPPIFSREGIWRIPRMTISHIYISIYFSVNHHRYHKMLDRWSDFVDPSGKVFERIFPGARFVSLRWVHCHFWCFFFSFSHKLICRGITPMKQPIGQLWYHMQPMVPTPCVKTSISGSSQPAMFDTWNAKPPPLFWGSG